MAQNKYPIVLVHGFAGWGRNELVGLKYWGGIQGDIQEQLKAQGYTVYTAAVGPFSSNWDRACELYAQIKGGKVDYGIHHARTHGHSRFGRTFPGLYPQWGDVDADGHVNKVHLVGHSMGGQTIRMLAQLLNKGSKGAPTEEEAATHPLFAGGKDWVHSITTIATPNQGTLVADAFHTIGDLVKDAVGGVFSALNATGGWADDIYDAKLDQWGISPKAPGESLWKYLDRVFDSPIFAPGVKDIALWSLSSGGAAEESTWIETLPDIYYFSYTTVDTHASRNWLFQHIQKPNMFTMFLPLQPLGSFLGGRYAPKHGFSEEWQTNDGVVNSLSMGKDSVGEYVEFKDSAKLGVWNGMPTLEPMDHLAVVGITIHTNVLNKLYSAHCKLLAALPLDNDRPEEVMKHVNEEQQVACAHVAEAVAALRVEAEAAAAAEGGTRNVSVVPSDQEKIEKENGITLTAWESENSVKPIPVYEQEP